MVSQQHGVELISARGVRPPIWKSLVCSCSSIILQQHQRSAKNQQEEEDTVATYHSESLHDDRKNN
jgi:hypothetical protein